MRNHTPNHLAFALAFLLPCLGGTAVHAAFQPAPPVDQDGRHGSSAGDFGSDIDTDAAGNVYQLIITDGTFPGETSAGGRDVVVAKFAPDGTTLWTTQLGTSGSDTDGGEIAVTASGVVGVTGFTSGAFPGFTHLGGFYDAFFVILDTDGNVTFTDQFGTSAWDEGSGVDTDGASFYVAGYTDGTLAGQTSAGGRDSFVRRYDLAGNVTGEIQFGTSGGDSAFAIAVAPAGDVFVTGLTTGAFSPSVGMNDGFVVKLDTNLNLVAGANHGTTANDNYRGIDVGANGDVVVAGSTFGAIPGQTAQGWDIVVQGIAPSDLSSRWIRQFGVTFNADDGWDVTVSADGTSYTACTTYGLEDLGPVGNEHGCVIALDALGSDLWNDQFIAQGSTLSIRGSGLDPDGGVWLAGWAKGTFGGSPFGDNDAVRRKYAPFVGNVTDITTCGFVADAPGDYRLAADVAGGGVCIDVTAAGVTLDLNGFTITSQDAGTDAPGRGIRIEPAIGVDIVNQGTSVAEILVESTGGIGIDAVGTIGASIRGGAQGVKVRVRGPIDGATAVDVSGSQDATVEDLFVETFEATAGFQVGVRADGSLRLIGRNWSFDGTDRVGDFSLDGAAVLNPTLESIDSTGGAVRIEGSGFDIASLNIAPGVHLSGSLAEIEGDGTIDGLVLGDAFLGLDFGGATVRGKPNDPTGELVLNTPTFEGFTADVTFGDNVRIQDGDFAPRGPGARIFVDATNDPPLFVGARFRKYDADVSTAVDFAPGASATFDANLTFETWTADRQSMIGSVGTFGTNMQYSSGVNYDPFVAEHVARVENGLVAQADDVFFFLPRMATGDKSTYVDGTIEAGCVSEPDGLSVTCPPRNGTHTFGHEVNDVGCGAVLATPGIVVLQDVDLTALPGTTCVEIGAGLTYDMLGRKIDVPGGSPGAETRGIAVTGAGATVRDGTLRLTGADAVGVDVTADDTTLVTTRYEYDAIGTRGIRAQSIQNFTVIDDTHVGSGPPGERVVIGYDSVGNLRLVRTRGDDPAYAYDFRWNIENSDGTITDPNWTGGISVSGAGVSATLIVERPAWDVRGAGRTLDLGDDVTLRTGRVYVNRDAPIGNRAVARGARLEGVDLFTYDNRSVDLLEDNPAAPVEVSGRLDFHTDRDGSPIGRSGFPPTVPATLETGIASRWAYDDRDSARLGDDLPAEPSVQLTFEQMVTPADPSSVRVRLESAGQDAIANGGCAVTSAVDAPVELTCDRDLGTGSVQSETAHYVYCGDGIRNAQVADDACDPGAAGTSGKCQSDCTIVPAPGALQTTVARDAVDPEGVVLTWNDTGEGPYEIFRSTDPATVTDPANGIGVTSGTTWSDLPPPGGPYHYTVRPAP